MRRLDIIKQRLTAYTDQATNTDEKLENGAIMDFVHYGESDMAWLIERVDELLKAAKSARSLLHKLGGKNHDPEYSQLVAAIDKAEEEGE